GSAHFAVRLGHFLPMQKLSRPVRPPMVVEQRPICPSWLWCKFKVARHSGDLYRSIGVFSTYTAKAARQSSGRVAMRPPSLPGHGELTGSSGYRSLVQASTVPPPPI